MGGSRDGTIGARADVASSPVPFDLVGEEMKRNEMFTHPETRQRRRERRWGWTRV
jgi:hypothetical protein